MDNSINIQQISKKFTHGGLSQLSLKIGRGITAVVGPNGAGKTTLLRCLSTSSAPDEGKVYFGNLDIYQAKSKYCFLLGYLPEKFTGPGHMTCNTFLYYMAALKLIPSDLVSDRIQYLFELLNLRPYKNDRLSRLSPGILQRLGLAQAILNDPRILLLDEPTSGLGPVERRLVLNLLRDLGEERIIVLTSHLLSDAEEIADNIIVLRDGSVVAHDTPSALIGKTKDNRIKSRRSREITLEDAYNDLLENRVTM